MNIKFKMNKFTAFNLIFGILSLIFGFCIYLLFRENTYIAKLVSNEMLFEEMKIKLSFLDTRFLKFYMVDYLWAFSFACFINLIFGESRNSMFLRSAIVFLTGRVYEVLQFGNVIRGTGDIADVGLYLLAVLTVWGINYLLTRRCRE